MSFKFEFKIDYEQLTKMLDAFLKRHADELLNSVISPCLVLKTEDTSPPLVPTSLPEPVTTVQAPVQKLPVSTDQKIDDKPLIGDELSEDPFKNLFQNSNQDETRFKDRNNIYNKKWNKP